jgi:predicted DNA-binding transcriptional regulator YafY
MDVPSDLLSARELAAMFHISVQTLYRTLKHGPAVKKAQGQGVDFRRIPDRWVGGQRFWFRTAAQQLLDGR